ncbi:MAG: hypothetical protein BJ554DRAFT_5093 [Olpidium bornovanus]|uniref:Uncharacterized protein n=1 Tax=Olpidium bornovanus TaxID=278681 RepID=A0A8H8DEQ4_9FUNG|nr:MAG: hypothetical protein BJ554DRAFT_5093 [Olpidium bornovanus]
MKFRAVGGVGVCPSSSQAATHIDRWRLHLQYRKLAGANPAEGTESSPQQDNQGLYTMDELAANVSENCEGKRTRQSAVEDLSYLIGEYAVTSSIDAEHGQRFAYEVETIFERGFKSGLLFNFDLASLPQADKDAQQRAADPASEKKEPQVGELHTGFSLVAADWVDDLPVRGRTEGWQDEQKYKLKKVSEMIEVDFELRYDHDLMCSLDLESTRSRLKGRARKLYGEPAVEVAAKQAPKRMGTSPFSTARAAEAGPKTEAAETTSESTR